MPIEPDTQIEAMYERWFTDLDRTEAVAAGWHRKYDKHDLGPGLGSEHFNQLAFYRYHQAVESHGTDLSECFIDFCFIFGPDPHFIPVLTGR